MERLAVQKYGTLFMKYSDCEYRSPCFGCESINRCNPEKMACSSYKALKKLAEYEELEEQGKLLKLPCAVGDIVYQLMVTGVNEDSKRLKYKMFKAKVFRFSVDSFTLCFMTEIIDENKYHSELPLSSFGKTVFLTREEAKSALKELNGEVS